MSVKFDFNNMFDSSVGGHGVSRQDLEEALAGAQEAAAHLKKVIADPRTRVKLNLEWVKLPEQDKSVIGQINKLAREIRAKYDNVVFLGIGGSYLGLKAAQDALCLPYYNEFKSARKKSPRVYFEGNNLDPDTLGVLLKNINPRKTFVVVISKSGETTETKAALMIVESWLKKGVGKKYGRQIAAITDPESGSLHRKVCASQEEDSLSFRSFPLLKGVGGRFSEFNMGLLHLAVSGVNIGELFEGAREMSARCSREDILKNPAYMYALLHVILYNKKAKSLAVLMPFSQGLKSTADWYVQLLAESTGKKCHRKIINSPDGTEDWVSDKENLFAKGRTPISAAGTNDLHSIQQNNVEGENNKVVTFIRVEKFKTDLKIPGKGDLLAGRSFTGLMQLAQEATEWALVKEGRPNCTIVMPEVDAFNWGGLLFFFEMATAFEGELQNINAFNQPGVEGYKNYMYYKLGKQGLPKEISSEIECSPLVKNPDHIL
ncbi:MAG: glucose-6-phosphate isomerase [Candidatus Omnitrophica bacterium]|nr:glucose-6-phosphate isomerase [Candidatus Omnitrophota bacterium]MDD5042426.1 glucose-6-phosphate isomerase [Candidatus Omnitrophota bacterium]MDD5500811.1 glucose-6-phosphate isomerase [Candidatus Omnitrophota bacterium]